MGQGLVGTVSMPLLRGILRAASSAGIATSGVLETLGLSPDWLGDSDHRVPRAMLYAVWNCLAQKSGDPALGLQLAELTQPGDFAVLDYAMRNSPTLGAAYARLAMNSHILHDGIDIVSDSTATTARLRFCEPAGSPPQLAEWGIALWLIIGRQITGQAWCPERVCFQHSAPPDQSCHQRIFQCPISFDAISNDLVFDIALREAPVIAADPSLLAVVSRYADELMAKVSRADSFADRTRQVVTELLACGEVTVESTGKRLAMSPRTLQRRLREDGSSFKAVLDDVRCGLAKRYLGDADIAIEETAFLLGFSESSAFHRAFKRWTGTTPSDFRARAA